MRPTKPRARCCKTLQLCKSMWGCRLSATGSCGTQYSQFGICVPFWACLRRFWWFTPTGSPQRQRISFDIDGILVGPLLGKAVTIVKTKPAAGVHVFCACVLCICTHPLCCKRAHLQTKADTPVSPGAHVPCCVPSTCTRCDSVTATQIRVSVLLSSTSPHSVHSQNQHPLIPIPVHDPFLQGLLATTVLTMRHWSGRCLVPARCLSTMQMLVRPTQHAWVQLAIIGPCSQQTSLQLAPACDGHRA